MTTKLADSTPAPTVHQDHICPYLGLERDPSVVARYPTKAHVCSSPKKRHHPALEHQTAYCLDAGYVQCPFFVEWANTPTPASSPPVMRRKRSGNFRMAGIGLTALLVIAVLALIGTNPLRSLPWFNVNPGETPAATQVVTPPATDTPVSTQPVAEAPLNLLPTVTPTPDLAMSSVALVAADAIPATPVPEAGGTTYSLTPKAGQVGWWARDEKHRRQLGDSFLYAGQFEGGTYVSAAQFDLSRVARGAPIRSATLRLTGLRSEGITAETTNRWVVQFVAEAGLPDLAAADFLAVFSAPAAITLLPELRPGDLSPDTANEWTLDENVRLWIAQQLVDGATSVTVRLMASTNGDHALFAWDSGFGSESRGYAPTLVLSAGPPPPTPPPLPTLAVIVATVTPQPGNLVTAVAQFATATADAALFGTPTPSSYAVVTPTPYPENLATVQANALAAGLPAVVLNTPVPANAATAEAISAYATAVALTTGTFTPVPTGYVTPMLVYPQPPAENVATAAAQVMIATAQAQSGVAVPTLPWNAVNAIYVYATPTPGSAETAIAMIQEQNANAVTTGTPTPTPWNLVVITMVPPPTPTPIPLIIPADQLEPTPTPTATAPVNEQDLDQFRGKILFLSDRSGEEQTWALDPATGEIVALVRDSRLHKLARERYLANSPDSSEQVIVQADDNNVLQIKIYSNTYGTTRQITHFDRYASYDPTWSPRGDLIAFVSTAFDGDEIYITDPEGKTVTRLTYNAWEWDKHPSWSPDGSQIVFYSNRGGGYRQIWIMNADGSNQRNLSNDEFENWDPVWVR